MKSMISRFVTGLFAIVLLSIGSLQAQQNPQPASPPSQPPTSQALDPGETVDGVYRNTSFGFTVKLPYGWVDRTEDMKQDSIDASKSNAARSTVLLATFERPPAAAGDSINSAIVITAESVSSYPGLKDPAQYFGPIDEIAKSKELTVINQPYDFPVDGMPIVRQDFSKKLGGVTMYQSSLVMLQKGYAVSFTFIAGSLDDITQNLESLRFGRPKSAKHQ